MNLENIRATLPHPSLRRFSNAYTSNTHNLRIDLPTLWCLKMEQQMREDEHTNPSLPSNLLHYNYQFFFFCNYSYYIYIYIINIVCAPSLERLPENDYIPAQSLTTMRKLCGYRAVPSCSGRVIIYNASHYTQRILLLKLHSGSPWNILIFVLHI